MYKLLELLEDTVTENVLTIKLAGKTWVLNEYKNLEDCPDFTCISYMWGEGTIANPFSNSQSISSRTINALEAVISTTHRRENWRNTKFSQDEATQARFTTEAMNASRALWIDAFCVPLHGAARTECLKRMGEIYSSAWQVIAVLPEECNSIFHDIQSRNLISQQSLVVLNNDQWISRGWTYQEAVNSDVLFFISQDGKSEIVRSTILLKLLLDARDIAIEESIEEEKVWQQQHQAVENYLALLPDAQNGGAGERAALEVMRSMHQRITQRPEDYFYAMVGAIYVTPIQLSAGEQVSASEYFMRVCEEKGDFSYIYNVAPRCTDAGRGWRPIEGKYPPILADLSVIGTGQSGSLKSTHLELNKVFKLSPGPIDQKGLSRLQRLIGATENTVMSSDLANKAYEFLRQFGYSGSKIYVELANGFFFTQSLDSLPENLVVAISSELIWMGGGPGLLLEIGEADLYRFHDIGVFVGYFPEASTPTSTVSIY